MGRKFREGSKSSGPRGVQSLISGGKSDKKNKNNKTFQLGQVLVPATLIGDVCMADDHVVQYKNQFRS